MKKILFCLCFVMVAIAGHAESMLNDQWKQTAFVGAIPTHLQVTPAPGSLTLKILTDPVRNGAQEAGRIFSVYQPLPECDRNGELKLTFEARRQTRKPCYLIIVVGSSPGNCPPCAHEVRHLTDQWQTFTVPLPLPGIKENSIFEFIWEGLQYKNDTIEIRNIALVEDESNAVTQCYIKTPGSLRLTPGTGDQTIGGVLLPLRSQENGSWKLRVFDEFDADKPVLQSSGKLVRPETSWQVDAGTLPEGKYKLCFDLTDSNGKSVAPIVRMVQKTADADTKGFVRNNTLYIDNRPVVPIGIYHAGLWNIDRVNEIRAKLGQPPVDYDSAYRDLAAHGFDTVHSVSRPDGSDIATFAAAAGKHGLKVIPELRHPEKYSGASVDNLIGWYGLDEASSGGAHKKGRELYAKLKALDPYTPIFAANYCMDIAGLGRDKGLLFDVLLFDHYVIREKDTDFAELSREMKQLGTDIRKDSNLVFGYVPQSFIFNGPEPSPEQLRVQIYLGVINGVRAFMYYSYNEDYDHRTDFTERKPQYPALPDGMSKNPQRKNWWIADSLLWDSVGQLNSEIRALNDFILNDGENLRIAASNSQIDFAARKVNGKNYFIAVNLTAKPVRATFRAGASFEFRGMFDPELKCSFKRGSNTLEFAPYEVKVLIGK